MGEELMPQGKIKIMVGGQVVGMSAKPIHIITEGYTKAEAIAEAADIKRSWEISGGALIGEPGDALREMLSDMNKMDVTIEQKVGKLPRKMKKALRSDYRRMTKWKRKAAAYISRNQLHIRGAEMVIDRQQQELLSATIKGGKFEHGCVVSGKQIHDALERYKRRPNSPIL